MAPESLVGGRLQRNRDAPMLKRTKPAGIRRPGRSNSYPGRCSRNVAGMTRSAMVAVLFLSACVGESDAGRDAGDQTPSDSSPVSQSEGTAEMVGIDATQGDLVDDLEASMQMMISMSADSMVSMVPLHRQTLAGMIVRMSQDMTDIRMAGDAAWTAAVDSVRNDLTRMPELGDEELKAFMPAHQDRVMRLIRMHRAMTARIGK